MSPSRNPCQLPRALAPSEVASHRNLGCSYYDGCLADCAMEGWAGWSCVRCPLKESSTPLALGDFAHRRRSGPFGE